MESAEEQRVALLGVSVGGLPVVGIVGLVPGG